jgi:catechol 2,3-dioxygenase-like lactoylglutathione lyase family enzyme
MIGILVAILVSCIVFNAQSQTPTTMKMNAGIVTTKLQESKKFYQDVLGFGVVFENDFYLLLHTPNKQAELSFLLPNHPTQQALFQPAFNGKGMFLTIEVADVDAVYRLIKTLSVPISIELRDEPWGDRHFAIQDPNGVGIDIVTYQAPKEE